MSQIWTDNDFESLSWHDNYVHGFRVVEGEYGAGEIWFDIDYILKWLCSEDGSCRFRIAPAALIFRNATGLRLNLDYASPSASLGPFSLDRIERERLEHFNTSRWKLHVSWPAGEISFESPSFEQRITGREVETDAQYLEDSQRQIF